ncbi:pentatricopeptide repeat-containing protein At3g22670, mitochondrial-like [Neltuma alba]|uniref:pentatricopeptide repeat-containing protein At3g22670, mitochondrial-like n=1 Tax=Neltuma alba TaxID=207710 RepID=UPI0010A55334|nr:pentatricopeptide repeat-containing protein At3g22670, mitochondrial-like [Prosopis alba]
MQSSLKMLFKLQILKVIHHRLPQRLSNSNGLRYFLCSNPLCTMVDSQQSPESPELPVWVKLPDNQSPESADSDDDFVIPALADWVNAHMVNGQTQVTRLSLRENKDDVTPISRVLKELHLSPDKVAESLERYDFLVSENLVQKILNRFCNDWIRALGFFIWAKTQTAYVHSPELYNFMVDILGKAKKFDLVWNLVEEMYQLEGYLTFDTMVRVIRRLSKAGKYEEAVEAFRTMERFGVKKDIAALNALMDALVKENSVEHAHKVLLEFKDSISPDVHSFNILIHGFCKCRKLDQAYQAIEVMRAHGFHPDVITYTSIVESYCREKDFRKVREVFEKMKEKGLSPNVITYTIFMHALGKAGQLSEVLDLYETMKSNGCVPDARFYSSLMFIFGRAGRLKDAFDLFDDMPKQGVIRDVITYNTMISLASASSQEETALGLLKEMEEKSVQPNTETYHPLLKMCFRKKRMKVLNFLLDHMFRNDVSLDLATYSLLINGLCESGKLERACFFFEEMVLQGLRPMSRSFKTLVGELQSRGMLKEKEHIENLCGRGENA